MQLTQGSQHYSVFKTPSHESSPEQNLAKISHTETP